MLVSIIIPCYNGEEYLRQAIESALNQDMGDIVPPNQSIQLEVIVVDDKSTDNSLQIAKECQQRELEREIKENEDRMKAEDELAIAEKRGTPHPRDLQNRLDLHNGRKIGPVKIEYAGGTSYTFPAYGRRLKIVERPVNMGLPSARNAGINATSTRYGYDLILPLDADDWIEPNYLKKTIPLMKDRVGVVGTWAAVFGIKDYVWHTHTPTIEDLMKDNCVPVCSLIRRGTLEETGNFYNIQLNFGYEDWNLWIDIRKRGWDIVILKEPLFHYREKQDSMLKDATKRRPELLAKIHSLHPDLWPPDGTRSMLNKWAGLRDETSGGTTGQYGIEETYVKASEFLGESEVEDWGCGKAYARKFFRGPYKGVDGTPDGCDTVVDLVKYTSKTDGILLRHVLEHNFEWEKILKNALTSTKKLVIVICTPFTETTRLLYIDQWGIPIFSFKKEDLTKHFTFFTEEVITGEGQGQTCSETIFYVGTDAL